MKKTLILSICLLMSAISYAQDEFDLKIDSLRQSAPYPNLNTEVTEINSNEGITSLSCQIRSIVNESSIIFLGFTGYVYNREDYPLIRQ
jgi:hypothetical protein